MKLSVDELTTAKDAATNEVDLVLRPLEIPALNRPSQLPLPVYLTEREYRELQEWRARISEIRQRKNAIQR